MGGRSLQVLDLRTMRKAGLWASRTHLLFESCVESGASASDPNTARSERGRISCTVKQQKNC